MRRALLLLLLSAALAHAAPPRIVGPTQVDAYRLVELSPDADTTGAGLIWDVSPEEVADVREFGKSLVFTGPPGKYVVKLRIVRVTDGKLSIETSRTTVVIGPPIPPPLPPDIKPRVTLTATPTSIRAGEPSTLSWSVVGDAEPTLTDDAGTLPVHPVDTVAVSPRRTTTYTITARNAAGETRQSVTVTVADAPSPAPIPVEGFRVLMVVERADGSDLTAGQRGVLYGATVRDYLDRKCPRGMDGRTPEYRIWDKDTVPVGHAAHWVDVMKRKRDKLPWIVVSNGKTGYEGPLPSSPAEALELLKKYGGE